MKTKGYTNAALAHVWARHCIHEGVTCHASRMFATHDRIYSYGEHFVIAKWVGEIAFITERTYSNSTAQHVREVHTALRQRHPREIISVPTLDPEALQPCDLASGWIDTRMEEASHLFRQMQRSRKYKEDYAASVHRKLNNAIRLATAFGVPAPEHPDWLPEFRKERDHVLILAKLADEQSPVFWEDPETSLAPYWENN